MPRRPIGDKPMDAAERQRRRRERLKAQQPPKPAAGDTEEMARLRRRVVELETQIQQLYQQAPMTEIPHRVRRRIHPDRARSFGEGAERFANEVSAQLNNMLDDARKRPDGMPTSEDMMRRRNEASAKRSQRAREQWAKRKARGQSSPGDVA